ncbi:MAG: PAS domain-containing sensor histidine kinase [Chloroflexota bacterium]
MHFADTAESVASRHADLAARWQHVMVGAGFVPLSRLELRVRFAQLLDQAEELLLTEAFSAAAARGLGSALVRLHFNQADALARSLSFLTRELPLAVPQAEPQRLADLLGEFAAGFMDEAQQATLAEQEAIRAALLSQRAQAEADLRDSEARFRAIFEGAAIAIAVSDAQGRLVATNPMLQTMLGYRGDEMLGQPFTSFAHPDDARADWHFFEELASGQRDHYQAEERYLKRDGGIVWARMTVSLVRDAATGYPRFAIGMGEDVTERKQVEAAFRQQFAATEEARSETRAILDATVEAMVLVTPDGVVRTINRRFEEIFALSEDTVCRRSFVELQPEMERRFSDPAAVALLLAHVTDTEERFTRDLAQRWPAPRTLELFSTPVRSADNTLLGRLYAFRDVTHEREVDRMKSEFVSLVSHELRTPLTSIKGYVHLLMSGEVGAITGEQQDFLGVISNNADRLSVMINDFLDLSRIESGHVDLAHVPVDLTALVSQVATTFGPAMEAKQQRLVLVLADPLLPVLGDPDRLVQVVTNLLSNAHKYTAPGGSITIAARQDGVSLHLAITDTGIGMTPDELTQLFTRFYRAKNSTTQAVGGTGLGLAITKSLVELHGGSVAVESQPGAGTTFTVTLPTHQH